ncbi:hypothetical protein WDA79_04315 [Streptomyces sp. A475]|uniref:hypothetical protein n=1 Tax=Streptomyces sp. A475 TaxID=3131976 RepID=UPI0030C929F6
MAGPGRRRDTTWMDRDNETDAWPTTGDRYATRPPVNRGLYLQRLRAASNQVALEHCNTSRQRRIVAYALTSAGGVADDDLATVRRLIEEKGHVVAYELTDAYAPHAPLARTGYAEARRLVFCGFADGIAVLDRDQISMRDDEYEAELCWYSERPALVLLHRPEAAP